MNTTAHATIMQKEEVTNRYFHLDYFIISESNSSGDSIGVETYGVMVQKRMDNKVWQKFAPSLFTNRQKAVEFVDCLCRNAVTPITLLDIVEDSFAEYTPERRKSDDEDLMTQLSF